jgi:UDP-3-O-[3-hydroxymyristoyl] glucosamine N-acyltransferase
LTIGDHVIATPQSGVPNDVPPRTTISGSPAVEHAVWLKASAVYRRLPEMYAAYRKLKSRLEEEKS